DANANRLREGLRVLEDIVRFILSDRNLTARFKTLRHRVTAALQRDTATHPLITVHERYARKDVGRKNTVSELRRKNISDLFLANAQRVKESLRVLEEFCKLYNRSSAAEFKRLRYTVYELEKRSIEKILELCHN
ncbi:MAG: thiamine phosphate synthase, partial [Candidatus Omnitrophica bacterium]|nr:thiamine phosphate synthase [Candidatus Omnitrophota bacterium]